VQQLLLRPRLTSAAARRFFAISSTTCAQVTLACDAGDGVGGEDFLAATSAHSWAGAEYHAEYHEGVLLCAMEL
jgi:hypothetical protein